MANNAKNFLVSTADFALYYKDVLAATGTTALNSSIEISMEEQEVKGGKGNKLLYSFKYGRTMNITLEAADWKLPYLAMQTGSEIAEKIDDLYVIAKCHDVVSGIVTLEKTPIGDVAVEIDAETIVTVTPVGKTVDLTSFGVTTGTVNVTYKYNGMAKSIVIDSDSSPLVMKLVLDADKHNNKVGKVGSVQIEVPSFALSGNVSMEFTPDGVTSTSLEGKALAVEGDKCNATGGAVYAYIRDFDEDPAAIKVVEIAASADKTELSISGSDTAQISVIGLKGSMYANIELDASACTFSAAGSNATVNASGVVTPVATGTETITVAYGTIEDTIDFTINA